MAGGRSQAYLVTSSSEDLKRPVPLFLSLLLLLLWFRCTEAADRLLHGQFLSGKQTIVSKGGVFQLGFFQPGSSPKYYVGIWYKMERSLYWPTGVVWVANREHPVFDSSVARFGISDDGGSLVVLGDSRTAWSSSGLKSRSQSNVTSSIVVLEDTGNLILKLGPESAGIWQSFDHPTHTWLPGGSIGMNKATGEIRNLVSWRSYDDPAPGLFSVGIDSTSAQLSLTWNGTQGSWSSGNWNGRQFSGLQELYDYGFDFNFTESSSWASVTYRVKHTAFLRFFQHTPFVRFFLEDNGQFSMLASSRGSLYFWPVQHVSTPCGPFSVRAFSRCQCLDGFLPVSLSDWGIGNGAAGCVRKTPIRCDNGSGGSFRVIPNVYPLSSPSTNFTVATETDCKSVCLHDNSRCSCTAYAFDNQTCNIWVGNLSHLYASPSRLDDRDWGLRLRIGDEVVNIPVAMNESHGYERRIVIAESHGYERRIVIAMGALAGVVLVSLGILLCWAWRRERKARILQQQLATGYMVMFSYHLLQSATKNFSEKLGQGGFGSVFRGMLPDNTAVAVKELEPRLHQGEKQFRAEVTTLGKVHHVNLVRLRGFYCRGAHQRLLVYDYMPNGSLDRHLFRPGIVVLGWETRYRIMLGIAGGLAYLHEECRDGCIVHCDIKPENILLDADFSPKVADFGMAKLIGRDFSRVLTTMRGTRGYLAPEWISGLPITSKADVYSYGMMLFELVSGKRNSCDFQVGDAEIYWPAWAATRVSEGQAVELLDPRLEGHFDPEEVGRVCRLACWCIQDYEGDRPSMGLAIQILEGTVEVGVPPVPESLLHLIADDNAVLYFTESSPDFHSQATNNCSRSLDGQDGYKQLERIFVWPGQ